MAITHQLKNTANQALSTLYNLHWKAEEILINQTKPEFEGDYTIVLFALVKQTKKSPEVLGNEMGQWLIANSHGLVTAYNVIKGFLNLSINNHFWLQFLKENTAAKNLEAYGYQPANGKKVMVEYSSPNTNKPLHLGHLRNNFLGWSVSEIFKANGYEIVKTCIVNDRGIHICKSMIAWQLFANGATPETTHTKGDHFVGLYYVKFNDEYKQQIAQLIQQGSTKETAEKEAPIMKATQQMLLDWEAGNPAVMQLWQTMNAWVYAGFDTTYKKIGSNFDKTYYESNTYLLGKKTVEEGLIKNVFYKEADNSVWIDLTADGLDKKLVQRKDGTSVYITQDIGLAQNKYNEYKIDQSIYVIGDEQNYHMKVLKLIAEKLELPNAQNIYHLSYGMVELPTGRMKSREGTVVDADDMVSEMEKVAEEKTTSLGKVNGFTQSELKELYHNIGLGALKFFLLRVDPKKKMIFNPEESIDFQGFTGPFIQYTHARIKSVLHKINTEQQTNLQPKQEAITNENEAAPLLPLEKELVVLLEQYPSMVQQACHAMNPSVIAIYVYAVAKTFSSFYAEHSIANAESKEKKELRTRISQLTAKVIKSGMHLLGINVPERM